MTEYPYKKYWRTCGTGYGREFLGNNIYSFLIKKDVETDADFEEVRPHLEGILSETVQWVNKYPTLKDLYLDFKDLPIPDRTKHISQPFPHKWAIILKLCNDPEYDNYIDWLIDRYTNTKPNPVDVAYFNALKEYLAQL